jgi:flavin-dependent dehydrogenase
MKFDVIIAGSGPAGLTTAIHVAKAGHKVLIIEKAPEEEIGRLGVGGVVKLDGLKETGIERSKGDELLGFIDTFNIYSPTAKTKKTVSHSAIIVDRYLMIQRLLKDAKNLGVTIKSGAMVKDLIIENNFVVGVTTDDGESFQSSIIVDSTGIKGSIKKLLPDNFKVEKEISPKHIAKAYVEPLMKPDKTTHLNSYLSVEDGYIWRTSVEVGFGSFNHNVDHKKVLHDYIQKHLKVETNPDKAVRGDISVRQNLYNMVGNGFMAIGDSASMVSPMEGAGITAAMVGAKMASDVINEAIAKNDFSQTFLWKFNLEYNTKYGAKFAYMDMLRRGIIGLSDTDIDFSFEKGVITDKDVLDSLTGAISNVTNIDKAQRAFKAIMRPGILIRMETCMHRSKDLKNHWLNYPKSVDTLDSWVVELDRINNSFH